MNMPVAMIALCACVLLLGACDKTPIVSETPMVNTPVQTEGGATAGSVAELSTPYAGSALPPANAAAAESTRGRSNEAVSAAEESTAMPVPGQNNDHSAPLAPAKRATSP